MMAPYIDIFDDRLFPEMVEHLSLFQTAVRKARASEDEVGVEARLRIATPVCPVHSR